jgi:hypothetical protein
LTGTWQRDAIGQFFEPAGISYLTLPEHKHSPSFASECESVTAVPGRIPLKFGAPELWPSRRHYGETAAGMSVPEATPYVDDCPVLRENEIRATWQSPIVESETQSTSM